MVSFTFTWYYHCSSAILVLAIWHCCMWWKLLIGIGVNFYCSFYHSVLLVIMCCCILEHCTVVCHSSVVSLCYERYLFQYLSKIYHSFLPEHYLQTAWNICMCLKYVLWISEVMYSC